METANSKKLTLFGLVLEVASGLGTPKDAVLDTFTPAEFWEALDWVLERRKENLQFMQQAIAAGSLRL